MPPMPTVKEVDLTQRREATDSDLLRAPLLFAWDAIAITVHLGTRTVLEKKRRFFT
jgi:hypothetical protein